MRMTVPFVLKEPRTFLPMAMSLMVLVPAIALIIGAPAFGNGVAAVFGLHAVFAMLFVGSALLFRKAARGAHCV